MSRLELVASIMSPIILSNGDIAKVDFKKAAAHAREAMKIDDSFYAAHKLNFTMEVLDILIKQSKDVSGLEKSLEGVKTFDYLEEDPQISDSLALAYGGANNSQGLEEYINDISKSKPDSGLAEYYRAMKYSSEKKYDLAYESVLKALEKDPYNEKFLSTKNSKEKDGKMNFSISLTLSIGDL